MKKDIQILVNALRKLNMARGKREYEDELEEKQYQLAKKLEALTGKPAKVKLIFFKFPALKNINCIFQQKSPVMPDFGNISFNKDTNETVQNRQALQEYLKNYGLNAWSECYQVHKDDLLFNPCETKLHEKANNEYDGLATDKKGLGLLIKTADCQPILIADKNEQHIMALHVGWRGNKCDFILSAIKKFCDKYKLEPQNLFAVRGPSLGPEKSEFINFNKEWGDNYLKWFDKENKTMNLWHLTNHQLQISGIPYNHIYNIDLCTASLNNDFFSYRKDKTNFRQANIIWINT